MRLEVIDGYGGACACCGEYNADFLALDHVVGGAQRVNTSSREAYRDARDRDFPADYQILCHNCNTAKGARNRCPCPDGHVTARQKLDELGPRWLRKSGARHHNAKLTEDEVIEIRRLRDAGVMNKEVAEQFDISESTASSIAHRKAWAKVAVV